MRERFPSISAAVSIRSKPNSRFQALCFSCINKRHICPRRCVAAQIVAFTSSDTLAKPRSLPVIFKNQIKNAVVRVHLTWSLQRSPANSRLSRVPWLRTPRAPSTGASYTGALLAALSVGSSAVCTRRTVFPLLWWCCRPGR